MFRKISLSLFLVLAVQSLQADYIIVKRVAAAVGGASVAMGGAGGVAPVATGPLQVVGPDNTTPEQQAELYRIMMTYEWPMSSAAYEFGKITRDEAEELFAPGVDSAEQNFIRKKIQTSELLGADFDVVFVPKTLYELFALDYLFHLQPQKFAYVCALYHALQQGQEDLIYKAFSGGMSLCETLKAYLYGLQIDELSEVLNTASCDLLSTINDFIVKVFPLAGDKVEVVIDSITPKTLWGLINDYIGTSILQPTVNYLDPLQQKIREDVVTGLMDELLLRIQKSWEIMNTAIKPLRQPSGIVSRHIQQVFSSIKVSYTVNTLERKVTDLLSEMIRTEYASRAGNYGYIVRSINGGRLQGQVLDGASCLLSTSDPSHGGYSLSYGNSLFAGAFRDQGACTFSFAVGCNVCYALEIDKASYVFNRGCNGLFFVSPLPTLSGLFGCGEIFHSRTRILSKETALGLAPEAMDYSNNISFLREVGDSFKQELLFQEYFVKHARFIKSSKSDPVVYLRASRAAITAMKVLWDDWGVKQRAVLGAQKQQKKAAAVVVRALRKHMKAREPKPAVAKRARCSATFD